MKARSSSGFSVFLRGAIRDVAKAAPDAKFTQTEALLGKLLMEVRAELKQA